MSNLSPKQFKNFILTHEVLNDGHHFIEARTKEDRPAGFLDWYHTGGEIYDIGVSKEHQRKGLATAMYRHAQKLSESNKDIPTPKHSETRTDEGEEWAKSLGEVLPKRKED